MRIRNADRREHIVLQMTAMIDIVFQLLLFFLFTFKIVLPEGDFDVRMPAKSGESSEPSETPVLKVRLRAGEDRNLSGIQLGDVAITGPQPFAELHKQIRVLIDDSGGPGAAEQEVELDCDYNLRYRYVINAMTAITGYVDADGQRHSLVKKVRLAPLAK